MASVAVQIGCSSSGASAPSLRGLPNVESRATTRLERDLFVPNGQKAVIVVSDRKYRKVGEITSGLSSSQGAWVDRLGNLYVANFGGPDVQEYAPRTVSPSCTYSTSLSGPVDVTTDSGGNVYVADYAADLIDKYAQCNNSVQTAYSVGGAPFSLAVDGAGDLFVAYYNASGNGVLEEFKGGSTQGTQLGASIQFPGGMALDKNKNLIVDDQLGSIDVVAPPYSTATVLVSGLNLDGPLRLSLNKKESLLFNANWRSATVTVYSYPSGKLVKTLGSKSGIIEVSGVAESPNAAF